MFKEINFIRPEVKVEDYKEAFTSPAVSAEVLEEIIKEQNNYCKLVIRPLERGYGQTLGNSLRRILLSSIILTSCNTSKDYISYKQYIETVNNQVDNQRDVFILTSSTLIVTSSSKSSL